MLVKIHKSYRDVIAICDKELLGKNFEEGNAILEMKEGFYNGEEVDEEKLTKIIQLHLREDATFNIVGKKSIEIAIKTGLISKEGMRTIQGIPFSLVLM